MPRRIANAQFWLVCLRHILGLIFIVASVSKLSDVTQFVNEVAGYGLLPYAIARVCGVVLLWAELFIGCSIVLGFFITPSLVLSILMTLSFVAANTYALYHGTGDSCACFGQLMLLGHSISLVIDILMTLIAALLLVQRRKIASVFAGTMHSSSTPGRCGMRRYLVHKVTRWALLVTVVVAMCLTLVSSDASSRAYSEIHDSVAQGEPVFLYFYLDGCVICEWQKPIIDDLHIQFEDSITFVQVDYRTECRLAAELGVKSVPAMLLIGHKNLGRYEVIHRFALFADKDTLQEALSSEIWHRNTRGDNGTPQSPPQTRSPVSMSSGRDTFINSTPRPREGRPDGIS